MARHRQIRCHISSREMKRIFEISSFAVNERGSRLSRDVVLGLLYIVAGLLGLAAVLFPLSSTSPVVEPLAGSIGGILAGTLLLMLPRPVSCRVVLVYSVVAILMLSYLVSVVTTQLGTALAAMPFIWLCVFFGSYFEARAVRLLTVLMCATFGVALMFSEIHVTISLWLIYSATFVVTTEALLATSSALRLQARLDPLTGLLNRRGLEEAAGPLIAIGNRLGRPTTLVLIDIDEFKKINDSRGHPGGDRILRELAASWTEQQRSTDLLARIGGDEFVIVLSATNLHEAEGLVQRYRSANAVRWSFGTVEILPGELFETAIDRADQVLYEAKEVKEAKGRRRQAVAPW